MQEAAEVITRAGFVVDTIREERLQNDDELLDPDEDVTDIIHPDNLADIALRAASLFGLNVAGIDIITPDIRMASHQNGAIINEVNFAPLLGGDIFQRPYS